MLQIVENILIAIGIVLLLGLALYILLMLFEWGLKIKSRGREHEGLTALWTQAAMAKNESQRNRSSLPAEGAANAHATGANAVHEKQTPPEKSFSEPPPSAPTAADEEDTV
jgi:hypothetical protein